MLVLVTAANPRTEKLLAAPSEGAVAASGRADTFCDRPAIERVRTTMIEIARTIRLCILFSLLPIKSIPRMVKEQSFPS